MSDDVIRQHIALYVNEFSIELGTEGYSAVETLFLKARQKGIIPNGNQPVFI
jgi:1,4-dihydroxy-6-naphthoate synthase